MKTFRASSEYRDELAKYGVSVFMTYFEEVSGAFTLKGVEAVMPVFIKMKEILIPSELTPQEIPEPSSSVA